MAFCSVRGNARPSTGIYESGESLYADGWHERIFNASTVGDENFNLGLLFYLDIFIVLLDYPAGFPIFISKKVYGMIYLTWSALI